MRCMRRHDMWLPRLHNNLLLLLIAELLLIAVSIREWPFTLGLSYTHRHPCTHMPFTLGRSLAL